VIHALGLEKQRETLLTVSQAKTQNRASEEKICCSACCSEDHGHPIFVFYIGVLLKHIDVAKFFSLFKIFCTIPDQIFKLLASLWGLFLYF